ncbi:sigma-70 family RNA polymerase sigma factor [bacterium]|nr:sigma-70 family RNA polymerase sigma factor [bacterium]
MGTELTRWLQRLDEGDPAALDRVVRELYGELRVLARARLRSERPEHTLGVTALVNEAYLRLSNHERIPAASRTRFFAVAANTMRRVLVDYARARKRIKRGGADLEAVPLEDVEPLLDEQAADEILALEDALERLTAAQPRAAAVVEHRFFSGLSIEEIAELLEISEKTVRRDWIAARAWLRKEVARSLEWPE